jgi:predicted ester cyclase
MMTERRSERGKVMSITAQDARAVVESMFDAVNARDLDRLDQTLAPDFVRHCEATPGLHIGSLDDFKAFLRADAAAFPDSVQTLTHLAAEGDLIGIFATYEGTHLGPLGPFPATGKRAKFNFAGMFKVVDGKLSEFWVTWDNMTILSQLGLVPAN